MPPAAPKEDNLMLDWPALRAGGEICWRRYGEPSYADAELRSATELGNASCYERC